jgi:hypothetical protein
MSNFQWFLMLIIPCLTLLACWAGSAWYKYKQRKNK